MKKESGENNMPVYEVDGKKPIIDDTVYIADGGTVIGAVTLAEEVTVWTGAVIRADNDTIEVQGKTNIQEGAILHADPGFPLKVGSNVTVGHQAMLHGCTIEDGALIGMGSIIMNGATIGRGAVMGAGAVVKENMKVPELTLVVGLPGKIVKTLNENTFSQNVKWAKKYVKLAQLHQKFKEL